MTNPNHYSEYTINFWSFLDYEEYPVAGLSKKNLYYVCMYERGSWTRRAICCEWPKPTINAATISWGHQKNQKQSRRFF
jgi:hypothetical protein